MPNKPSYRLAAILAADVVGYTRLVEQDTEGTVRAWTAARDTTVEPEVSRRSGIIVKLTGDGFLAEFPTIQNAVECAMALQEALAASPLDFRMGISLGDIIDDGQDIHGEGVNLAARVEALAAPGGICVTGVVFDTIRNRVDIPFEDLGLHTLKHVAAPIRVWHWSPAVAVNQVAALQDDPFTGSSIHPDVPSVAVLPFDNMSSDPEQEHFADGMCEDLITDLSKISGLFVVARNSTFAYKGKAVDIRSIATELGVRYVLEGSVRKSGGRVRINAQLIDASTGAHLWADRYDGSVDNVFELQDEVSAKVVSALSVELTPAESNDLKKVHTRNLDAYELFVRARATPYPPVPDRINNAIEMFERVIELDPDFAGGYAGVSMILGFQGILSHGGLEAYSKRALDLAQKAIEVDDTFGWSYLAQGMALLLDRQHEMAIAACNQALERQPNDADAHAYTGFILGLSGQYTQAMHHGNQALLLDPQFIHGPYLNMRACTELVAGRYADSIATFQENMQRGGPAGPPALAWLSAAYAGAGDFEQAASTAELLHTRFPAFRTTGWNYPELINDAAVGDQVLELMSAGGVPR